MGKVVTVTNNKGGCGKTLTVVNVGAGLRLQGFDVLLVDFDSQANLTTALRASAQGGTTYDAMKTAKAGYISPARVLDPEAGAGVLDVLPSSYDLAVIEMGLATERDAKTRFSSFLEQYREKYDYIVIDTPPALGMLTINALYAADAAVITVEPEYLPVQGLLSISNRITQVAEQRGVKVPFKVLFTRVDSRKGLHSMSMEMVQRSGLPVFSSIVRSNVSLGEAPAAGLDIFRYSRRSNGAKDYEAVTAEVAAWCKVKHKAHK